MLKAPEDYTEPLFSDLIDRVQLTYDRIFKKNN